jgi:tetratricopeptide (TPR) repeat protein
LNGRQAQQVVSFIECGRKLNSTLGIDELEQLGPCGSGVSQVYRTESRHVRRSALWFRLGFSQRKQFVEAEATILEGLRLDPADAKGHFCLAFVQYLAGRFPEAERSAREAIRYNSDYAGPHALLAKIDQPGRGIEDLKDYLKLKPAGPLATEARVGFVLLNGIPAQDYATNGFPRVVSFHRLRSFPRKSAKTGVLNLAGMSQEPPSLHFSVIEQPLDSLLSALENKIEREWPPRFRNIQGVQHLFLLTLKTANVTYRSVRFLCADTPCDPARRVEYSISVAPLNRRILDNRLTL